MAPKVGCIIQGNVRRGSDLILKTLPQLFDYTVFSTWDDEGKIPQGNFDLIRSPKPLVPGFTNRNYQRFSVARGIEAAQAAGCDYVLKWRSDMLPTQLSIESLLEWANFSPPINTKSRIVLPAFRNISINPDTFSSIPDLISFGHIDEMEKLWGDVGFDYSKEFNMPLEDQEKLGSHLMHSASLADFYCAEAELYSLYRAKLAHSTNSHLNHKIVAENYLYLIDHNKLGILWFGPQAGFRSIGQAWEHPWWTVNNWLKRNAAIHPYRRPIGGLRGRIQRKISRMKVRAELKTQEKIWQKKYPAVQL